MKPILVVASVLVLALLALFGLQRSPTMPSAGQTSAAQASAQATPTAEQPAANRQVLTAPAAQRATPPPVPSPDAKSPTRTVLYPEPGHEPLVLLNCAALFPPATIGLEDCEQRERARLTSQCADTKVQAQTAADAGTAEALARRARSLCRAATGDFGKSGAGVQ